MCFPPSRRPAKRRSKPRYQWPASALGRDRHPTLMSDLDLVSDATGRPVTQLLKEAALRYVAEIRRAMPDEVAMAEAARRGPGVGPGSTAEAPTCTASHPDSDLWVEGRGGAA